MISVIILTAGRKKRLECTLASLVNQTFKDFEIIIGTDGDLKITNRVIKIFDKYLPNIKHVWIKDTGEFRMGWTFNKATKKAQGKYCLYLGEDTLLPPHGLETIYNIISTNKLYKSRYLVCYPRIHIDINTIAVPKLINDFEDAINKAKIISIDYNNNELDSSGMILKKHLTDVGGHQELISGISGIAELKIRLRKELNVKPRNISLPTYHIYHEDRNYVKKHHCRFFLTDLALLNIPRTFIKKYLDQNKKVLKNIETKYDRKFQTDTINNINNLYLNTNNK